jgi:curved DNA-binding protein CbpA
VSSSASAAYLKKTWKAKMMQHHPDRGGQHDTMQLVNGARDLLLGRGLQG